MKKKITLQRVLTTVIFLFLATAPAYMTMFRVNMLGKYMCFAIVAIGLDMIWGYTGILSLGHGVYFGLGAYCMAMYMKIEAAGSTGIPDFMSWSGITELPAMWKPFANPAFAIAAVIVLPALVAIIIGYLTFLNRIKGVYFSILSQALAMIASVLLIGQQGYTGGSNGLTGFRTIFGISLNSNLTKFVLFYITLAVLILIFAICSFIVKSRTGKVLIAIRDGENRARFTGYNPAKYKVFVYTLSAIVTGIAGALFVMQVGIISPTEVAIVFSVEMIIWVAIGGKGTLIGPVLGALLINSLKTGVSERFPDAWSYFIGIVFIVAILWLPGGIVSLKDVPAKIKKAIANKKELKAGKDKKAKGEAVC